MTTNKDLKRLVRGRMQKTGESYTAARTHVLSRKPTRRAPQPTPPDYAGVAGMSDTALKAKTGCNWERWVWALDRVEAHTWPHRKIAQYVHTKYKVPDWWTQTVTVGYERIKGLRAKGQRRDGAFEATKSKVFTVAPSRLFRAFTDARTRRRWLPDEVAIRTAVKGKSIRTTWKDGSPVEFYFTSKGARKSQVQVQHRKLPDKEAATRAKEYWNGRFEALVEVLTAS